MLPLSRVWLGPVMSLLVTVIEVTARSEVSRLFEFGVLFVLVCLGFSFAEVTEEQYKRASAI